MRLSERWHAYWLAPATPVGLGLARIGVFLAVLHSYRKTVHDDYAAHLSQRDHDLYSPVGILKTLGDSPPSPDLLEAVATLALVSTLLALAGAATRVSMPVSALTVIAVVSFTYSWGSHWSHGHNIQLLCALMLAFSHAGDSLSIDSLIRRVRGKPPPEPSGSYRWPMMAGQLLVAFMFANASFWKLRRGWEAGSLLGWALSDNLRNDLGLSWYRFRGKPPALTHWIISREWAWKSVALGNIAIQVLPLVAVFMHRRPSLRAVFGLVFAVEVIGLWVLLDIFNEEWLLLAVFFIDWDWLLRRTPNRRSERPDTVKAVPIYGLVAPFVGYLLFVGLTQADLDHELYPFSAFPMYASIRASQPYDEHADFHFHNGRITIEATKPVPDDVIDRLNSAHKRSYQASTVEDICAELRDIEGRASALVDGKITSVRLDKRRWIIPAYPEDPDPALIHRGELGRLTDEGDCVAIEEVAKERDDDDGTATFDVRLAGFGEPEIDAAYRIEPDMQLVDADAEFSNGRVSVRPDHKGMLYFMFTVTEDGRSVEFFGPYMLFPD